MTRKQHMEVSTKLVNIHLFSICWWQYLRTRFMEYSIHYSHMRHKRACFTQLLDKYSYIHVHGIFIISRKLPTVCVFTFSSYYS